MYIANECIGRLQTTGAKKCMGCVARAYLRMPMLACAANECMGCVASACRYSPVRTATCHACVCVCAWKCVCEEGVDGRGSQYRRTDATSVLLPTHAAVHVGPLIAQGGARKHARTSTRIQTHTHTHTRTHIHSHTRTHMHTHVASGCSPTLSKR